MKDFFGILFIFTKFSCDFFPCICRRIKGWSDDNSLHFLAKVYFVPVWTFWKRCEMWRVWQHFVRVLEVPPCPPAPELFYLIVDIELTEGRHQMMSLCQCASLTLSALPAQNCIWQKIYLIEIWRHVPWTLGLVLCTLDHVLLTLDPTPYNLYPESCTLDPGPWTLEPEPWNLDLTPWTLVLVPCTLYPVPFTLYPYSVPSTYLVRPVQHCNLHFKDSSNNVKKVKSSKITEVTCETVRLSDGPR